VTRRNKLLMIPGPTEVSADVLSTLSLPLPAHYMDAWVEMFKDVTGMLKTVFGTKSQPFIITGSGSSGLEAAAAAVIEPGDKIAADVTGDDVFAPFVQAYGAKLVPLEIPPGTALKPDKLREILRRERDVKAIATSHNITSAGVTNPIKELAEVAKEFDALVLADVISSIGGIELKMDEWGIDICCGATQKALSVPPGLALVAVSDRAWSVVEKRRTRIGCEYLNLLRYREAANSPQSLWHPTPDTCSTLLVKALQRSLKNLLEEGLDAVYKRHETVGKAVREALKALGLELLVADEIYASNTVTGVRWPSGPDYRKFWRTLYDEFDIMIGNPPVSDVETSTRWFRVGHMGTTASSKFVLPTLAHIEIALSRAGYRVDLGQGVGAAEKVFEAQTAI
jgi:aspartate aminotransferase-like enzyme